MKIFIIGILSLLPLLSFASTEDQRSTREIGNRILKSLEKDGSAYECIDSHKVKSQDQFSNDIHGYVANLAEDDELKTVFMKADKRRPGTLCYQASLEVLEVEI